LVRIYENRRVFPRAFVAGRPIVVKDPRISLGFLGWAGFDPSSQVLLAEDPGIGPFPGDAASEAVIEKYTYYPGWEVAVDGVPGRIIRADHAFRGVPLDGGGHRVVFRYRPASFRLGTAVSLAACGALIVFVLVSIAGRRGDGRGTAPPARV
jgi:hypothetical protein